MKTAATFFAFVVAVHAGLFIEDNKEYEYDFHYIFGSGTNDVSPHQAGRHFMGKMRAQFNGNNFNVEINPSKESIYVGHAEPNEDIYTKLKMTDLNLPKTKFSVSMDNDGKFSSLTFPSNADKFLKNAIRALATIFQVDRKDIKAGKRGFVTPEETIYGKCDVTYTVTDKAIYKVLSHMKDCKDRPFRLIDDWRGNFCDNFDKPNMRENPGGLYSQDSITYHLGDKMIKKIEAYGLFVAQFHEDKGMRHFSFTNVTFDLVTTRSNPGDISASGDSSQSLKYEFGDSEYKWNVDRDLKAREPFYSWGKYYEENQSQLKTLLMKSLSGIVSILESHGNDEATVTKHHKNGLNTLFNLMNPMDYSTLKAIADTLLAAKSEDDVTKSNFFLEALGTTGTTAAAMVIKDLVMENKFDTTRDAGRTLSAVPYHIRRPNTQLVKEYEKLLNFQGAEKAVKMAIPLTFGHLVRITCIRAGHRMGPERKECFQNFASKYVDMFWNKFKSASDREEKSLALNAIANIRFGGVADKLKPLIYGYMPNELPEHQTLALWAAGWDAVVNKGVAFFLPVFADRKLSHEVRIAALVMLFHSHPSTTDLATVLSILKTETDYEVVNYAFSLFEQYADTIDPCEREVGERAKYFLKYMKRYSNFETSYGIGMSKTFVRQYQSKKYGHGGSYHYHVIGSHASTTPISLGMAITSNLMKTYDRQAIAVYFRIEGLAKAIVRKFKNMDPTAWKTADLDAILKSEMNIRERPDQPVSVSMTVMIRGSVFAYRAYDENSLESGGKIAEFMESLSGLGDTYSINHQRMVMVGSLLYEQPSLSGRPLAYVNALTFGVSLKAEVKRGNHRGLIFRNINYDINVLGQAYDGIVIFSPTERQSFAVMQSRIYHIHLPRKIVIGLHAVRREIKLSLSRPPYDDPAYMLMHSMTFVTEGGPSVKGDLPDMKKQCSSCGKIVVVSRGPGAAKKRIVRDYENTKLGYYTHSEYFDCEMDISPGNTRSRAIMAFLPYNKNPRTLSNSISGGFRQILAYLVLYPRTERCGIFARWSQSKTNPVKEIEISVKGQSEENGARLFFRGRKTIVRAVIKAKGDPDTRAYRLSVAVDTAPGRIHNKVKVQINRAAVGSLGIKPYTICGQYESKYPNFGKEFLSYSKNDKMAVMGKASLQYGEGTECDQGEGHIGIDFKHETTAEGHKALEDKWYYQKCMEEKQKPEWSGLSGDKLPPTEACYMTIWDATNARHYTWKVKFIKITNRLSNIIAKIRSVIQAGLLPYWDTDPDQMASSGSVGPFMNLDVVIKNGDKAADLKMETSQGVNEYKDYPLKLKWTNRLRNLKMTQTIKRLMEAKIISPCVATSGSVLTNDNVTYSYTPGSCWTLTSGHCGPKPSYAVFSKKVSGSLPLAVKAYFGGHVVDLTPSGNNIDVKINGSPKNLVDGKEEIHKQGGTEIFKIFKWGSTVNIYSFLKIWVAYDGNFVQVMPAPSVRGQHCGLCGNFNRNQWDEWTGKDGKSVATSNELVDEWKWKC